MQRKVLDEEEAGEEQEQVQKPKASHGMWEKDTPDEDGEVIKIDVGQSVEGILMDKFKSLRYSTYVYKVRTKEVKLLIFLGSTILDKMMQNRSLGEEIKVTRLPDQQSQSGRTYQVFETFHKKD